MISAKEYTQRRARLLDSLPNKYAIALVGSGTPQQRIPSIPTKFRQHSDLLYLTGYEHPHGVLALSKASNDYGSTLFVSPPNKESEKSDAFNSLCEDALRSSGVEKVLPMSEMPDWLSKNILKHKNVYESSPKQAKAIVESANKLSPFIDQLRVVKSATEIRNIKKSCGIAKNVLFEIKKQVQPGNLEGNIAKGFVDLALKQGATGFPYEINGAAGKNALDIYYKGKDCKLNSGDCFLLRAGVEYNHYASDFTRTVRVGKVSKVRHEILMMVEDIKNTLFREIMYGAFISPEHIHIQCLKMLSRGLQKFGVRTGLSEMRELFPHNTCHWIGLDVNDTPSVPLSNEIRPGNVISIAPGLYFDPANPNSPKELAGLGVRFEDTVICE